MQYYVGMHTAISIQTAVNNFEHLGILKYVIAAPQPALGQDLCGHLRWKSPEATYQYLSQLFQRSAIKIANDCPNSNTRIRYTAMICPAMWMSSGNPKKSPGLKRRALSRSKAALQTKTQSEFSTSQFTTSAKQMKGPIWQAMGPPISINACCLIQNLNTIATICLYSLLHALFV